MFGNFYVQWTAEQDEKLVAWASAVNAGTECEPLTVLVRELGISNESVENAEIFAGYWQGA